MTDQLALDLEPLNLEPIAPGLTIQERFAEFDRRTRLSTRHSSR
jgi:hypothetical protein